MKFAFALLFCFLAVQLSESFLFNRVTPRPTQRPFSRSPWAVSGEQADPVILDTIKNFIENNIVTPFVNKVLKPIEDRIIRPLEQNLKQKLAEFKLTTVPQIKKFFQEQVLTPFENGFQAIKEQVGKYIETFGQLISKESRDKYKKQFFEFVDTKIRQPLLSRVKSLLEKIESGLETNDVQAVVNAEPVFLETIKEFIENNIVTPFINKVIKPIEDRIIRPLEQNFKQKLAELQLNTIPQIKKFFQEKVLTPLENGFQAVKEQVGKYIETFGVLISKESRDKYKQQFFEFVDTKIRAPLLKRVQSLLEKVENSLESGDAQAVADVEPYFFETIKDFVENNIVTPFVNKVIKPIEDRIIRPLEENFKQKLAELQLNTIPQVKKFFQDYVLTPIEDGFNSVKDQVNKYIETFGMLISKESRDKYKQQFSEFVDTKIRAPLLKRVQGLLEKVENSLQSGDVQAVADVEPYFFETIKEFVENNIVTPFINKVIKPIEDRIIRPLEQNFKQKMAELQLNTIPQIKKFFQEQVLTPIENGFKAVKEQVGKYIETFGVLISKESRDKYKQQFFEFVDTKIRAPLLKRVQSLLEKVENSLESGDVQAVADVEPYFFETIKDFVENNIVTPFVNKVIKPIEDRIIRPLEENFKQKLAELQLNTIPQVKKFFQDYVLTPIEDGFNSVKDQVNKYIETFGKLISKESRDKYKQQFSEFVDNKIRLPLLQRVQSLLEKVERSLDN